MRRREFLGVLGGAAASWPVVARAQQRSMPVVGFLHIASAGPFAHLVAGFRQGLKETGFIEDQNVAIEFRWAEGHYEQLAELAAELVRMKVAVLATGGGENPALAAKAATTTIPRVFVIGNDPVEAGLVASIARPGSNVTGVTMLTAELEAKRLGLLDELVPKGAVFAHLVNPNYPPTEFIIKDVAAAAQAIGRTILLLKAKDVGEIDAVLATIPQHNVGGLLVAADPFFNARRDQIVLWTVRHAIPAAYEQREYALAGGLMSYGTNITEAYRQMGIYTGRILKGDKPGDLPVVRSAKFELVVNMKTARTLGLTLPSGLLSIIDEAIE